MASGQSQQNSEAKTLDEDEEFQNILDQSGLRNDETHEQTSIQDEVRILIGTKQKKVTEKLRGI